LDLLVELPDESVKKPDSLFGCGDSAVEDDIGFGEFFRIHDMNLSGLMVCGAAGGRAVSALDRRAAGQSPGRA